MNRDVKSDETLDVLGANRLKFIQPKTGYRFSIDSLLLWGFLRPARDQRWVDLGTGCGILAIALAKINGVKEAVGVEIQPELVELARRNARLNFVENHVSFVTGDIRDVSLLKTFASADGVCVNPPYYAPGSGRLNPDAQKAVARHEIKGTINDFIRAGSLLLSRGSVFDIILPVQRLQDALKILQETKLYPSRMRPVHSYGNTPATLVLIEAVKGKKSIFSLEPPVVVYKSKKIYTQEIQELMNLHSLKNFYIVKPP